MIDPVGDKQINPPEHKLADNEVVCEDCGEIKHVEDMKICPLCNHAKCPNCMNYDFPDLCKICSDTTSEREIISNLVDKLNFYKGKFLTERADNKWLKLQIDTI